MKKNNEVLNITYNDPKDFLPEENKMLLIKINYDDSGDQFCYQTSGFYKDGTFYTFNGVSNTLEPGENVTGWRYSI